ncbi:MAG TPA: hypothetical protein VI357_19585 [Mycobacteriales bacterium]
MGGGDGRGCFLAFAFVTAAAADLCAVYPSQTAGRRLLDAGADRRPQPAPAAATADVA